jgi:hypothetical protein
MVNPNKVQIERKEMKSKAIIMGMSAAALSAAPLSVKAWDSYGHMEVACVAYQHLSPQAKTRVDELIQLNPNYHEWSGWVPARTKTADKQLMLFMIAATWPDEIKSTAGYSNDGSHNGDRPDGSPDPTGNTGYTDMLRHKYWHFIDKPFATDGTSLPPIPNPNAQERIALFRGVLGSSSGDPLKSYDLVWLLHLVGDVHQPLHCTTRVSATDTAGDNGGNGVSLSSGNLHGYWDDLPGTGKPQTILKKVIKAGKKLPAPDPTAAAIADETTWVTESFQAAQQTVYHSPIQAGDGPFTLNSAYKSTAKNLSNERISLAGVRLANLINDNLK